MQVVTSENFQQLVETGKVDEFKPPADAIAKAADTAVTVDTTKGDQPRGDDGKFVAKDTEVKADTEQAANAAVDDDDDGEGLPDPLKKKIDRIVNKKHQRMKEAEEYARELRADREAARERADRAEAALKAAQDEKSRPASEKDSKEPRKDDFATYGEYADALVEYRVNQKFAERDAKAAEERNRAAAQAAQEAHFKRVQATAKEIPDYAEVVDASDIDLPPHLAVYIAESPMGPRLGYHLAKHADEFDRISKLSPIRAIAELGKLETKLEAKADAPAKDAPVVASTSRAPAPITPIDASAKTVVQKDPSKMTIQELREYDRAQRLAKAR